VYAFEVKNPNLPGAQFASGLVRIEFHPTRVTSVPGSRGLGDFAIRAYAISARQDKIVISGIHRGGQRTCGIFELSLAAGSIRQVTEKYGL
jgi:hypothetical protein